MSNYEQGRWDMFVCITTEWFGDQTYFLQDDGIVYSRKTGKYMTVEDAYWEFIGIMEAEWVGGI